MGRENEWGVIQRLRLEADTRTSLVAAITILLTSHSKVEAWKVKDGELQLLWHSEDGRPNQGINKLPSPLEDPEKIADLIQGWLELQEYPCEQPDTDGSVKKGYAIRDRYEYVTLAVQPCWIIYGK